MAFSFGAKPAAASTGGTGGFSFGASSATTPKATGFSFGATPAPAPASGFSFGASPATSAPATGFSFGATAATSAPATGFSFGAKTTTTPAPTTGFAFGGATSTAPTATGGLFGATAAKPTTGFSFGATPAPAPSLFGAASTPAPAFGGFGATPAAAPTAFGATPGFGATATAAQGLTPTPTSEIEAALKALFLAYADKNPGAPAAQPGAFGLTTPQPAAPQFNKDCRFKHLFYNMVGAADRPRYQRPDFVDQRVWDRAERDNPNPDILAPTPVIGFGALQERVEHQHAYSAELMSYVKRIENTLHTLEQASSQTETAIQKGFYRHHQLYNRFLQVLRKLEVLRSMGLPLQVQERELHRRLDRVANSLAVPTQRLTDLQAHSTQVERSIDHSEKLKEEDLVKLHAALQHQRQGLEHLTDILKKDLRDVHIMKQEISKKEADKKALGV